MWFNRTTTSFRHQRRGTAWRGQTWRAWCSPPTSSSKRSSVTIPKNDWHIIRSAVISFNTDNQGQKASAACTLFLLDSLELSLCHTLKAPTHNVFGSDVWLSAVPAFSSNPQRNCFRHLAWQYASKRWPHQYRFAPQILNTWAIF